MQQDIHQTLMLAAAANATIAGRHIGGFWPNDQAFEFTQRCIFQTQDGTILAEDPPHWLNTFKSRARYVWVHNVQRGNDDRKMSAFVGGGSRWLLEALKPGGSDLWECHLQPGDPRAKDRKSWNTLCTRIATDWQRPLPELRAIADVTTDLARLLPEASDFAQKNDLEDFVSFFRDALAVLDGAAVPPRYRGDKFASLASLAPDATRLYESVQHAWNFGGMGSWNDIHYSDDRQARYERLSGALFTLLCEALVVAANSTFARG
jgi:hypothetical protein